MRDSLTHKGSAVARTSKYITPSISQSKLHQYGVTKSGFKKLELMGLLLRVYYDQASYSLSLLYSDVQDEKPTAFNAQLARLGLRAFLKMVLEDNFAHSDLHPGNIIVCRLTWLPSSLPFAPA